MKAKFLIPVAKWLRSRAVKRPPDLSIGGEANPYMRRWYILPRNKYFCLYLHQFVRSDDDRALHDHPAHNLSFVFDGVYLEHTAEGGELVRTAGDIVWRKATARHRIELLPHPVEVEEVCVGHGSVIEVPKLATCWTLFVFTYKFRDWGFYCPKGWRRHDVFEHQNGCGET